MFERFPKFMTVLLVLLQSCGGGKGDGSATGNKDPFFQADGPDRSEYVVPSKDPLANYQWHLKNTGQIFYTQSGGTLGEDINLDPVRSQGFSGHGVLVAVSDNGCETTHPDLQSNIIDQYQRNYTSDDPNQWSAPATVEGSGEISAHGTAVSGLIASMDGNGLGGMGVAPRSKLAVFKYVGTGGNTNKAIDQANGPFDIFNFSYGRSSCTFVDLPQSLIDQFEYGVENLRNGKGAIYVKAAGNEYISSLSDCQEDLSGNYYGNANLEEEHSHPYLIVTAAYNSNGYSSSYSTPGSSLWISAPGGEFGIEKPAILTTDLTGCQRGMANSDSGYNEFEKGAFENPNCNYTNTMNGTSSSTPIISGVIALMLEANPSLTWRDVKLILAKTARKLDANGGPTSHPQGGNLENHTYSDGWKTNAAGHHFHNWYGFGSVDTKKAVEMAALYSSLLPPFTQTNWTHQKSGLSKNIPDANASGVTDFIHVVQDMTIEAVQIKLSLTHTYAGDIGVELTSPSGTKSILMHINSNILEQNLNDALLLSNAFYGENSKGNWTLKVIDGAPQDQGTLTGWKMNIFGHFSGTNLLVKSPGTTSEKTSYNTTASSFDKKQKSFEVSLVNNIKTKSAKTTTSPNNINSKITYSLVNVKTSLTVPVDSMKEKNTRTLSKLDKSGNVWTLINSNGKKRLETLFEDYMSIPIKESSRELLFIDDMNEFGLVDKDAALINNTSFKVGTTTKLNYFKKDKIYLTDPDSKLTYIFKDEENSIPTLQSHERKYDNYFNHDGVRCLYAAGTDAGKWDLKCQENKIQVDAPAPFRNVLSIKGIDENLFAAISLKENEIVLFLLQGDKIIFLPPIAKKNKLPTGDALVLEDIRLINEMLHLTLSIDDKIFLITLGKNE